MKSEVVHGEKKDIHHEFKLDAVNLFAAQGAG